jgi:hypothetical protein
LDQFVLALPLDNLIGRAEPGDGIPGAHSKEDSRMAGSSPEYHVDRVGYCLGDCSGAVLAFENFEVTDRFRPGNNDLEDNSSSRTAIDALS